MFNLLLKVTHDLNFDCAQRCQRFKKTLICIHGLILFLKISFLIPDIVKSKSFYSFPAHFMAYVGDLEMTHFIIETNLIARLFENLNSKLLRFSKNKLSTKHDFLMKIWKTNYRININSTEKIFIELTKNCGELLEIISNINYSYTVLVNIYKNCMYN